MSLKNTQATNSTSSPKAKIEDCESELHPDSFQLQDSEHSRDQDEHSRDEHSRDQDLAADQPDLW